MTVLAYASQFRSPTVRSTGSSITLRRMRATVCLAPCALRPTGLGWLFPNPREKRPEKHGTGSLTGKRRQLGWLPARD